MLQVESDNAPYLNVWNDRPKLNYNWVDNANPRFGSASCDSLSGIFKISYPASSHLTDFLEAFRNTKIAFVIETFIVFCKSYKHFFKIKFYVYVLKYFKFLRFINHIYFR